MPHTFQLDAQAIIIAARVLRAFRERGFADADTVEYMDGIAEEVSHPDLPHEQQCQERLRLWSSGQ